MAKSKRITAVRFASGEVYPYRSMWDDCIAAGRAEALHGKDGDAVLHERRRQDLLRLIPVGSGIKVVMTHSTRNGGARFRVFVPEIFQAQTAHGDCAARIRDITGQVADLVGFRTKDGEIVMSGWGYSKSFQIGYSLGLALWPNGTTEPHGMRNGEPDTCGGYAISVY